MRSIAALILVALGILVSSCGFFRSDIESKHVFSVSEVHQNASNLTNQKIRVSGILHLEWESDKLIERIEHKNVGGSSDENRKALVIDISRFPELRGKEQIEEYWLNRKKWGHLNHSCVIVSGTLGTDMPVHLRRSRTLGMSNVSEIRANDESCGQ